MVNKNGHHAVPAMVQRDWGGGGGGGGSFLCKLYHVPNIIIGNGREYSSCYINYYNLKGGEGGGEWSIKGEVI